MQIGYGTCNGTFGELVQGEWNKQPFLITLPIPPLKSEALFFQDLHSNEIFGFPTYSKAILACKKVYQMFNLRGGGTLFIRSNIPRGKGMASSSADLVAAIRAIADCNRITITHQAISTITAEIEPTDGVMYEEVVAYDYMNGQLIDSFGHLPPFGIFGIDIGGSVNTIQFNKGVKPYTDQDYTTFSEAYELMKTGMKNKDLTLICQASTMSAKVNEKVLPKNNFQEFERIADLCRGGIVVAHSGTMIGILFHPTRSNIEKCHTEVTKLIKKTNRSPFYYSQMLQS